MIARAISACLLVCLPAAAAGAELLDAPARDFAAKVAGRRLGLLPVQYRGRVAILDTFARDQLDQMHGSSDVQGLPPAVACLELYFHAGRYADRPLLYVREKNMRAFVAKHLDAASAKAFAATRRIAPASLLDAEGWALLVRAGRARRADFDRSARVRSLRDALPQLADRKEFRVATDRLSVRYGSFLAAGALRVVPHGTQDWLALDEAYAASAARSQPAGDSVSDKWLALQGAWRARDAAAVNRLIGELDRELPAAAAASYPLPRYRTLERLYNRTRQATVVWVGFAAALVLMIVAAASGRRWAWLAGMGVFTAATLALAGAFVVRWLVSGWAWYLPPIMNQFEAVIGSAVLGAVVAIVLELAWRKSYFALAASLYATIALLSGLLFPEQMDPGVRAQHGILASPVMGAHVAVIIIGHALVGMTFFISLAYLAVAAVRGLGDEGAPPSSPASLTPAGALSPLGVIDRCNLIVAQLACWTVVVGTILGAYWGDFAWGRWWGWDPKETWALITCLVYVGMLHVRFITPVGRRGLATALICILGCAVMLFNWIVVNYVLAGKHSYA